MKYKLRFPFYFKTKKRWYGLFYTLIIYLALLDLFELDLFRGPNKEDAYYYDPIYRIRELF